MQMQGQKIQGMMSEFGQLKKQSLEKQNRRSSKEYDVLNLMLLSAFDNSLANTRGNQDKLLQHRNHNNITTGEGVGGGYEYDKGPYNRQFQNVGQAFSGMDPFYFQPNNQPTSSRQYQPTTSNAYRNYPNQTQQSINRQIDNPFLRNSMQIMQNSQLPTQNSYYNPNYPHTQSMPTLPNQSQYIQPATANNKTIQSQPYQVPKYDPLIDTIEKQNKLLEGLASNLTKGSQDKEKDPTEKSLLEKRLKNLEKMQKKLQSTKDEDLNFIKSNQLQQHRDLNQVFNPYSPQNFYKMQQQMVQNQMMPPWMKMQQPNQNQQALENMKLLMLLRKVQADNEQLKKMKIQHIKQPAKTKGKSKKGKTKGKSKGKRTTDGDSDGGGSEENDDVDDEDYNESNDDDYDEDDDDDDDYDDDSEQSTQKNKEEEEKQKLIQHQKEITTELQSISLRFRFLGRYFAAVKKSIIARKTQVYETMNDDIAEAFTMGTDWILQVCSRGLNLLIDVSAKCDINPKSKISLKEQQVRVDFTKARVKALLDGVIDGFVPDDMEAQHKMLSFFSLITHDFQFPPQNFLFKFEINRLKFTYFGALKEMSSKQGQMIILMFLIIRILVYKVVLKPWEIMEKVKETVDLKINIKVIASIIYEITMDYLRGICAIQHNNQSFLSPENKIKEKPGLLRANNDPIDPDIMKEAQKGDEPIIIGLFTKEELPQIFEEQREFVDMMKSLLEGFGENIYTYCDTLYKEEKAKEKQETMANKMKESD